MARTTTNDQLFLNDGTGKLSPIATGIYQSKAIDMSERRRLSITAGFNGGFTGTLLVEGTDELGNCAMGGAESILRATGASIAWAGAGAQPGQNGMSGAKYWNALPSGTVNITNATNSVLVTLNDVNCRWIRVNFNKGVTVAIGSGTIELFVTAKNT